MFLTRIDAAAPRDRVIRSGIAVLAGIALCITGLLLERACKVPGEDDDDDRGREPRHSALSGKSRESGPGPGIG